MEIHMLEIQRTTRNCSTAYVLFSATKQNTWTSWSAYSECDEMCYKSRQRYCYGADTKACGGNPNAYGIETDRRKCSKDECPGMLIRPF